MTELGRAVENAKETLLSLKGRLAEVLVGLNPVVDEVLFALLSGGHVLLEGAPGLGKTLLVRSLASALRLSFSRIQFTPDLMPSDIVGTEVLQTRAGDARPFSLHRGPVFAQMVLADEINRATPKTQSALLEAMAERTVTIFGTRHDLGELFFVLATENPIEMEGTYPLPEAQLDRFLLKVVMPNPKEDELCEILRRTTGAGAGTKEPLLGESDVLSLMRLCREVVVSEPVIRYAAALVQASDPSAKNAPEFVKRSLRYGAGVRGAQALILSAKAASLLDGRLHASFADVRRVANAALRHRLLLSFAGEAEGISPDDLVTQLLSHVSERPKHVEALRVHVGRP